MDSVKSSDEAAGNAAGIRYFTNEDGSVKIPTILSEGPTRNDALGEEVTKAIEEYKWKEEDFLLATYPKNGTHFMWEVMMMLLRESADYIKDSKGLCMIDMFPLTKSETMFPSPRVLNTHYRLDVLPKEFRGQKTVLVLRNPKDTAVSYYHHEKMVMELMSKGENVDTLTFSEYLKIFLTCKEIHYGNYFDYIEYMWTLREDPNMLVIYFEDLKTDTLSTVQKVNEFMGTNRSPELVQAIASAVEFSKMRKGKEESMINAGRKMGALQDAKPTDEAMVKMTKQLYRKGEIGDWKNHFTVAENEMFDEVLDKWSVAKEIPFRY